MKIKCKTKKSFSNSVKVRVIKSPIVDSEILKQIVFARTKAIVL